MHIFDGIMSHSQDVNMNELFVLRSCKDMNIFPRTAIYFMLDLKMISRPDIGFLFSMV
jgi:hypothetical protein